MDKWLYFDNQSLASFKGALGDARKVVIVSHRNADGDAVGSSLGMWHLLRSMGHDAVVLLPDGCPATFRSWMPGSDAILNGTTQTAECAAAVAAADLLIGVDFNKLYRISVLADIVAGAQCKKVLIDHHEGPEADKFDIVFSQPSISSTCELCYWLINALRVDECVSREVAICLFTGIRTDTGGFQYSCSHPSLYEAVSVLIAKDIEPDRINHLIFDDFSERRLRFFAFAIEQRMRVFHDQQFAYIYITHSDMQEWGILPEDVEGLVNYTLKMSDIEVGVLIREEPTRTKLSFRAKFHYNVEQIAREHFGGGGHIKAAGADVKETPIAEVLHRLETIFLPESQWTPMERIV